MENKDKQKEIEQELYRGGLLNEHYNKAVAKVLTEAGYRKADEVRKEALKVAYQNLYDMCKHGNFKNGKCGAQDVLIWAREEGIELDE